MEIILDSLLDAVLDSLKLLPYLFITYLVMEYIEEKAGERSGAVVGKAGRFAPLAGGLLGVVPQCGFSAAASNLYAGRVITPGTLIAIFLSTSDEMLPILISERVEGTFIIGVLALKVVIGVVAGYIVDFVYYSCMKRQHQPIDIHHICEKEHCHCHEHDHEEKHEEHDHDHDHEGHDHEHEGNHEDHDHAHDHDHGHGGIVLPAVRHTVSVFAFILIFSIVLNLLLSFIGEDTLGQLIYNRPVISEILAGIVGLIPNCASSVLLTQLYLEEVLSFAATMSGLLVNAGVGLLVLFRINDNRKENLAITGTLYAIGVICGCIIEIFI